MKKLIYTLMLITTSMISCKKDEKKLDFSIIGKEYAARWKVDYNNRQSYVHLKFEAGGQVKLFTSIEKLLLSEEQKLTYTQTGNSYNISGTITKELFLPAGSSVNWTITPTKEPSYEGSTIRSTFDVQDLHFVDQR